MKGSIAVSLSNKIQDLVGRNISLGPLYKNDES
jgi:hypothetical protein